MAEVKKAVIATIQRLEATVDGHNTLAKDVKAAFNQNEMRMILLDRTLQNSFGKQKWTKMVGSSNTELAEEMVTRMKAEEKLKQDEAVKALKAETEAKTKAEAEARARAKAKDAPVVNQLYEQPKK